MMDQTKDKDKSIFISYRNSDGVDMPLALYNYLSVNGFDVFFDQREKVNDDVIKNTCVIQAGKRSNFVIFFSEKSINRLIQYCKGERYTKDYVYEELNSAIREQNNIIPVFFEANLDGKNINRLTDELFVECFELQDSYSYVRNIYGEMQELFQDIKGRIGPKSPITHIDFSSIYWVGTRESDMPTIGEKYNFKAGIFCFGTHSDEKKFVMCDEISNIRVDHNDASDKRLDMFIEKNIEKIIKRDPKAQFMFYNPASIYKLQLIEKYGKEHFLCLNDEKILNQINNKGSFRELLKGTIPLLPVVERMRVDCDYEDLLDAKLRGEFADNNQYKDKHGNILSLPKIKYDDNIQFIVQAPVASGGSGTFILNKDNAKYILAALDKTARYLVSVYHTNNIPVNMHIVIFDDGSVLYLPPSIQIEREIDVENKLLYKGADFIEYKNINVELREQFEAQVALVADVLYQNGYRGVCGVDAIMHNGRVNILEVNARFQASTELLNRTLLPKHYSLQELNYIAFQKIDIQHNIPFSFYRSIKVPYSNYAFSYEGHSKHDSWFFEKAVKSQLCSEIQSDGYHTNFNIGHNAEAYLYRVVFKQNIVSISEDRTVLINENICGPDKWLENKIIERDKLAVKLALMIQGITLDKELKNSLREATNNAIDLKIGKGEEMMIVNSPTNIRYVEFSPFTLKKSDRFKGKYYISYYGDLLIDNIDVFLSDDNQKCMLKSGTHSYSEIAYLSTDRLRIHLTNKCCYKPNQGCKFCNIEVNNNNTNITPQMIEEVVDKYVDDKQSIEKREANMEVADKSITLRHFLIGGQSLENGDSMLIEVAKKLCRYRMPIYVMTLPLSKDTVRKLVQYGVYEFAFNIEIFNEDCRKKYMPGKGNQYTVDDYMSALIETRKILCGVNVHKNRKAVRSMVIIGLEPYSDMLDGIKKLIKHNIEPMLSVFRPLPETSLGDRNAPPIKQVYELFCMVSSMLHEESIGKAPDFRKLGPACRCCQNNTVSLPWDIQKDETKRLWSIDTNKEKFEEVM